MAFKFLKFANIKRNAENLLSLPSFMNSSFRYFYILVVLAALFATACSVGNKDIPDPGGVTGVDTSNTTLNSFQVIVSGDTSFIMSVITADSLNAISNDSLVVAGAEIVGTSLSGIVGFKTYSSEAGTYLTEGAPPGITSAEFGILKTIRGVRKIYPMNHGTITITEHNFSAKTVKGRFDVNNEFNITANVYLRCRGNFYIKYQ